MVFGSRLDNALNQAIVLECVRSALQGVGGNIRKLSRKVMEGQMRLMQTEGQLEPTKTASSGRPSGRPRATGESSNPTGSLGTPVCVRCTISACTEPPLLLHSQVAAPVFHANVVAPSKAQAMWGVRTATRTLLVVHHACSMMFH
jgi:hypothetical protein